MLLDACLHVMLIEFTATINVSAFYIYERGHRLLRKNGADRTLVHNSNNEELFVTWWGAGCEAESQIQG